MRTDHPTCRPDLRNRLAPTDDVIHFYQNVTEVQKSRRQTVPMIEYQSATRKIQIIMRECNNTVRWREYLCAYRCGDINTVMRLSGLAVQNSLTTVNAADSAMSRPNETREKIRAVVGAAPASAVVQEQVLSTDAIN